MSSNLYDVLSAVGEADLRQAEERLNADRAARKALAAQRNLPTECDLSSLLAKMDGEEVQAQAQKIDVPKPAPASPQPANPEPTNGKPRVPRFPPPPTGGVPRS